MHGDILHIWLRQTEGGVVPVNRVLFDLDPADDNVTFYCVPVDDKSQINPEWLSLDIDLLLWKVIKQQKRLGSGDLRISI